MESKRNITKNIAQNNGENLVYESENIVDKMIIDLVDEKYQKCC